MFLGVNKSLIQACGDYGLVSVLKIVQRVMGIIQIIVPIVMVCGAIFILIKMMLNPEEKKNTKALFNCIAAGVIVIFLPFLVNLTMSWLDDSFSVTACWKVANSKEDVLEWNNPDTSVTTSTAKKKKIQ